MNGEKKYEMDEQAFASHVPRCEIHENLTLALIN